jgi:hypothetical protein
MHLGGESLALRYLVSMGAGYLAYLLTVWAWASALLRPTKSNVIDVSGLDVAGSSSSCDKPGVPAMHWGGGGDFGGGGASGDFSDGVASGVGDLAGGALEVTSASDEAAIVVVPVLAVFLIGCAIFFGAGMLMLLYFGWEVLLAVAVELAFSYATVHTTVRVAREGWARTAVRLTWKPLAGAVVCAVVLGATIDHFIPTARSLPQALKILRTQGLAKSSN